MPRVLVQMTRLTQAVPCGNRERIPKNSPPFVFCSRSSPVLAQTQAQNEDLLVLRFAGPQGPMRRSRPEQNHDVSN